MVGDMNLMSDEEIEFFMTWFPKKEDYDIEIQVLPDETLAEKIQRSEFSKCHKLKMTLLFRSKRLKAQRNAIIYVNKKTQVHA